jgi:hypothetical protein
VEHLVSPRLRRRVIAVVVLILGGFGPAAAQTAPAAATEGAPEGSRLWLVAGGAFVTLRGDCRTCEEEGEHGEEAAALPYRHGPGVLGDIGYRVTERMDVGAEVFWTGFDTAAGHLKTTHLDAVAQFRPWRSRGFFLKGGAGMAFVRNWVDTLGSDSLNSKALSVVIGGGWAFRPSDRVGMLFFATQHAAALGDFQLAETTVEDVLGNFWSIGAAIVIR